MAVSRSPFSKPNQPVTPTTEPPKFGRLAKGNVVDIGADMTPVKSTGQTTYGTTTSMEEEKQQLDKAYSSALAKIANSNQSERTKEQLRRTLEVKYKQGGFLKPTDLSEATSLKGLAAAGARVAFMPIAGIFGAGQTVSRYAQSAVREASETVDWAVSKATNPVLSPLGLGREKPVKSGSWKEFVSQAKNKDFRLFEQTGVKWLDGTIDFVADAAFDPLSYTGVGELQWIGKSGKMALVAKLGTADMLAKHPQLVGKLDDILRYGAGAVPKEVRSAEGIGYGVRFMGKVIPKSEAAAAVFSGKPYSVLTRARTATGDIIAKSKTLTTLRTKMTPSSRVGLVLKNAGRNKGLADRDILPDIAHWTATKYAKGYKAEAYNKNIWNIRETIKKIRNLPDSDQSVLYDLVENKSLAVPAHMKEIVDNLRTWQDSLRDGVNDVYRKFNTDFNGSMRDIGFVDDFVHHRITDEALRWVYGRGSKSGFFKDMDILDAELGGSTGAALHRKIRAPEVLPDGTVKYSQFMGEDIKSNSVIKEVNDIFRRKTGLDVDFFSTDMVHIADSYAYSMAAARGREAYFRRLLDYGSDFSQIITQRAVPNRELVKSLTGIYNKIVASKTALRTSIRAGRAEAVKGTAAAVRRMSEVLDNKAALTLSNSNTIKAVEAKIVSLEDDMARALKAAEALGAEERGAFYDLHKAMFEEVQQLKASIANGDAVEYATVQELKDIYLSVYPNAKRIPKSATKLIDAINRSEGVPDTAAFKEVSKRLKALQKQLEDLPSLSPDDINEMLDIERTLTAQVDGHEALGAVRLEADYAEDGLVYGSWDDLTERPFDPNIEGPHYRVLSTRPVVPANGDLTTDEMAAIRRSFMVDENSVAVHAPSPTSTLDLREPDDFYSFWDAEGAFPEAVANALDGAGINGDAFRLAWQETLDSGVIPDEFVDLFPELADIMSLQGTMMESLHELGVVDDEFISQSFGALGDLLNQTAALHGLENSDMAARQMFDNILAQSADDAGKPILMPSRIVMGEDNPMADGAYSLIVPDGWSYSAQYPKENLVGRESSPVNFVKDNEFIRSIMDEDYHTAALDASERLAAVMERTGDYNASEILRQGLRDEINAVKGSVEASRSAGAVNKARAMKAWETYQSTGQIEVTVKGAPKMVTRDEALDILNVKEAKINSQISALEDRIARSTGRATAKLEDRLQGQRERLATLFNQRKVLERWDEKTGAYLRRELEDFQTVVAMEPAKDASAAETRAWSDKVRKRMQSIDSIRGTKEHKALDAVFTQLHADEAQLAYFEAFATGLEKNISEAKLGNLLPRMIDDINSGWTAIEGMGIQMPPDMAELIKPNLKKLKNKATQNGFLKAIMEYQNAFKIYATMSLGFGVRNAISAVFMNQVAGVSPEWMGKGLRAAVAYHKHGPVKWLDALGITDAAERALYEEAMRSVLATGRGVMDDFMAPSVKGIRAKITNNPATRGFSRMNSFIEDSVRLPMALDTLSRGNSYDDAVYRISRYHFDYTDLSALDETAKRYFVPFWVWTTRNIPLQMTEMVLRPSTYMNYERIREKNPVADDVIMPRWLAETGPLGAGGTWVINPDLPHNRLMTSAESFLSPSRLAGQTNPLLKTVAEIVFDKQLATGIPFTDKYQEAKGLDVIGAKLGEIAGIDGLGYRDAEGKLQANPRVSYALGSVLPPVSMAQRLTGGMLGGKESYDERQLSSLLSWLGVPVRNVGPRQQRGELINRQFQIAEYLQKLARKGEIESGG